jgi:uncharacterized iron-regulated membrane protein
VLVCTTGAALVFRLDMQRALYPELFAARTGTPADAATILERVRDAYPGHQVYGIESPTPERHTTIAYVAQPGQGSRAVLIEPTRARILGQLPPRSFLNTLGGLHANLLAGRPGRIINGIGSLLLLLLCATGLVVWWPGTGAWRSGFMVNVRRSWTRINRELHGAVGIWTVALIGVWAVTGVFFAAHSQVQSLVNAISPLRTTIVPTSNPAGATASRPGWRELIERAQARVPGQSVVRVLLPYGDSDPFQVAFSPTHPAPALPGSLTLVHLDQYTGDVLKVARPADRSAGDRVMDWMGPLHLGNFGGLGVRIVWFVVGLAPAVLAVTGFIMWWSRVVRPRARLATDRAGAG